MTTLVRSVEAVSYVYSNFNSIGPAYPRSAATGAARGHPDTAGCAPDTGGSPAAHLQPANTINPSARAEVYSDTVEDVTGIKQR